ncbi:hypothetical protein [Henriciella litoralis]|uniref:hypothetical protein n=1 Tax=Henriciella litoralis TaxID=568102 RepID=UPI000A05B2DF|nr:hypothetical protein [Henriciella litoralis]
MSIRFALTIIAAAMLAPLAASAMTYEEAKAIGVSPVTGSEMLTCANYWDAWADSLNPDFYGEGSGIWTASFIEKLHPEVQLPAARETSDYWFAAARAEYEKYDDVAGYEADVADLHEYYVAGLDHHKFMQLLGECARPE